MKRTRQEKVRLGVLLLVMCAVTAVILGRLVQLQIVNASEYQQIVNRQSGGEIAIPANRGVIFDRTGMVVANNIYRSSLYAYPHNEEELTGVSRYLEKTLKLQHGSARKVYGLSTRRFRWIKRLIDDKLAARIEREAPAGLFLRKEAVREYPCGEVGKQILGFTDIDNLGRSGFEYACDSLLRGVEGRADIRRDGLRNTFRVKESALVKPQPGRSVVLSIDWRMQEIVQEELKAAVEKYKARSAMAAFVDCNNGDILSMAHYDPGEKNRSRPIKLRTVTDQFEPGSVFKIFTAAALLDKEMINFEDTVFCEEGKWRVNRRTLHDDKELGWLNFRQIMELSSNIGIGKYAIELGGEEILETARRFGLGQKLLEHLPGTTAGKLTPPPTWSDYNTASVSIGHAVATSAAQMAIAMGAVANGGQLLKPRLILGYVDDDGYVIPKKGREVIGRAMKQSSADTLRAILRGVVERGTAEAVNSDEITIAGKTGTAQIFDVERNRYFSSQYMASFAGFFPAENPLVAGFVVLERPHPVHYGGWTAGPAFRRIAERYAIANPDLFSPPQRLLVEKDETVRSTVEVPDLVGEMLAVARQTAEGCGLRLRGNNTEGVVVWQFPAANCLALDGQEILIVAIDQSSKRLLMVDLRGLSIRTVTAFCDFVGVRQLITGYGKVISQSIRPGRPVNENDVCRIKCRQT